MKLMRKQLRRLIIESYEEMRSQEAISGAQTHMRKDGMSFQDFAGLIVDKLNLYDEWLSNSSVEDVVANLSDDGQSLTAWDAHVSEFGEPTEDEMSGGGGLSETNDGTPLNEMPASWQQILRTKR